MCSIFKPAYRQVLATLAFKSSSGTFGGSEAVIKNSPNVKRKKVSLGPLSLKPNNMARAWVETLAPRNILLQSWQLEDLRPKERGLTKGPKKPMYQKTRRTSPLFYQI